MSPISVSRFVWEHEPKKLKGAPKAETAKETDEYIYLDKEKTMMIEKSQYTMDMMGSKGPEDINKKNNS